MATASPAAAPSLTARLVGVVRAPRGTLRSVAAAPHWAGALAATFLIAASASAAVLVTEVGRLALLDRWERTAFALGRNVTDTQYAAMADASGHGVLYAVGSSFAGGPLLAIAVSAVVWKALRSPDESRVTFRQVLAVVAHSHVILSLRQVVAAPIIYARETLASPLTVGSLVPGLDEASAVARFLAAFDVFVVWWLFILALGVSVLYRRPTLRLSLTFVGLYGALAAVLAGVVALFGGTA